MKKLTLVVLCVSIFIVSWKFGLAVGLRVEMPAVQHGIEEFESSGDILADCVGSGSGEENQSGDSSAESFCESGDSSTESGEDLSESGEDLSESGESSSSIEGSGDHDENFLNFETLHASSEQTNSSDLIFLDSLEAPAAEIETSPVLLIAETEMSGSKKSMDNNIDDDEDF